MGAKHGGLLAIDVLLEKGQERVKISCKCPDKAFLSNTPRKHRQGLWNETVPWNVACIQILLSLSLGFFLLHILSNPPQPRLSVLVQVGKSQPGEQSNSLTEILHQSSKLLSTTNSLRRK